MKYFSVAVTFRAGADTSDTVRLATFNNVAAEDARSAEDATLAILIQQWPGFILRSITSMETVPDWSRILNAEDERPPVEDDNNLRGITL